MPLLRLIREERPATHTPLRLIPRDPLQQTPIKLTNPEPFIIGLLFGLWLEKNSLGLLCFGLGSDFLFDCLLGKVQFEGLLVLKWLEFAAEYSGEVVEGTVALVGGRVGFYGVEGERA